jgi:hypothetical protein
VNHWSPPINQSGDIWKNAWKYPELERAVRRMLRAEEWERRFGFAAIAPGDLLYTRWIWAARVASKYRRQVEELIGE